jgi:hypothetical protein
MGSGVPSAARRQHRRRGGVVLLAEPVPAHPQADGDSPGREIGGFAKRGIVLDGLGRLLLVVCARAGQFIGPDGTRSCWALASSTAATTLCPAK